MTRAFRIAGDTLLALLLVLLVSYISTGGEVHECLGLGMLALLVAHHAINRYWYKALPKGRYTPGRALGAALDFLLLADVAVVLVTGLFISQYLLDWRDIGIDPPACQALHISAGYWGLILMGLHVGLHTPWLAGVIQYKRRGKLVRLGCHLLCYAAAGYGVYAFIQQRLWDYLTASTHFVFCNATPLLFLVQSAAMFMLFCVLGHFVKKWVG